MIEIHIKPAKSPLKRKQWKWEIRGNNNERIDPRDTYNNRQDAIDIMTKLIVDDLSTQIELVVHDSDGAVERREVLR